MGPEGNRPSITASTHPASPPIVPRRRHRIHAIMINHSLLLYAVGIPSLGALYNLARSLGSATFCTNPNTNSRTFKLTPKPNT